MSNQQIKNLYLKFIKGECTKQEIDLLIELLQSTEHEEGLPTVEEIIALEQETVYMDGQVSEAIFQAIITPRGKREESSLSENRWKPTLMVAASLIILFLMGILGYTIFRPAKTIYSTDFAEKKTIVLPDGSRLLLNANTSVETYQQFLDRDKREVWIVGEAFFDIAPNQKRPFVVHTAAGLQVQVLGTAFNLKARDMETHVVLNRGSVKVAMERADQKAEVLVPGEMILLDKDDTWVKKSVDTLYYAAWQYDLLPFDNESLANIARIIEEVYGYEMSFKKTGLEKRHFTGALPSNNIDKAVATLSAALNCEIIIHDNKKITINQIN
ncbi:FecR domain-containing protein [Olivibacter sp. CPCC 100613]|uniref:FecR family protein n=1 Tax=Olivibacter sp. CPCC 100613 TaxID=3079931 RepID=UPI002FFBB26E